jgi:hypothetical protein
MYNRLHVFRLLFVTAAIFLPSAVWAETLDRNYRMGDTDGAANGQPVSTTFDSEGHAIDLTGVSSPTYTTITGRPDGVGGLGISFNAAQQEYLRGPNLGWPEVSRSSFGNPFNPGPLDYVGITNRGFQFWVRPTATSAQSLVMDTNQHGVRINSSGRFSMQYVGVNYDSGVAVVPNTWYHVMLVRPSFEQGSRLYINGAAVAAAIESYDEDTSDLVVGSNTGGDEFTFTGGTEEFFSGIIDDLEMFVMGTSTGPPPVNYGGFDFATDNDYADFILTGVPGDVNSSGSLTQADKDAFISGWMDRRVVNGIQIPDLVSFGQGDLNLDGITNIQDLVLMQAAISGSGSGMSPITAAELAGVPEPTGAALLALAIVPTLLRRRVRSAM